MAPTPERDQRDDQQPREGLDGPPRAGVADRSGDTVDARKVDVADPPHDRVVDRDGVDGHPADTVAIDQRRVEDGDDRADEPARPGGAEMTGQGRGGARRAGGPPPRGGGGGGGGGGGAPGGPPRCPPPPAPAVRAGRRPRRSHGGYDNVTHQSFPLRRWASATLS